MIKKSILFTFTPYSCVDKNCNDVWYEKNTYYEHNWLKILSEQSLHQCYMFMVVLVSLGQQLLSVLHASGKKWVHIWMKDERMK